MIRPPPATPLVLNLAPMVDVMMCLLIFFMLAAKLVEIEQSRIDLPLAAAAREAERRELGNRFVVNLLRETPDRPTYLLRERPVTLEEVLAELAREHRQDAGVNCVIRADRNVPYADVEAILSACAGLGVRHVTFSATRGPAGGT
jgi:biopolymer transport protein ExbD